MRALDHDVFNIAQSAAYSAIVALFPALIVAAAIVPMLPDTAPVRSDLAIVLDRVLPADTIPVLAGYFSSDHGSPIAWRSFIPGMLVSLWGSSGVVATFMEGLRRAYDLPIDCWSFLRRRLRAIVLVPLSLLPLALASLLVLFGHYLALRLAAHGTPAESLWIYHIAAALRWLVALASAVGVIAMVYKLGTPLRQSWAMTLPGAALATVLWFASTLVFGWYVTRFANYSRVYGSLGAGIALLFWLFLASLSVLCGAEYNAQLRLGAPGTQAREPAQGRVVDR